MNFKKLSILGAILLVCTASIFIFTPTDKNIEETKPISEEITHDKDKGKNDKSDSNLGFLKAISGVKATQIELIDKPVGIKGSFSVPKKAILNGVDYFLKNTNNDKMENVKIDIEDGYISLKVDYKVSDKIVTPIEAKVIPSLNKNKDLDIKIEDVKFLDLKISNWIVNAALKSFIKDWFPTDGDINIKFNEGSVIIYKDNFKGILIGSLKVKSTGLSIDMTIDFSKLRSNKN